MCSPGSSANSLDFSAVEIASVVGPRTNSHHRYRVNEPERNSLAEFRESLLAGRSGVVNYETAIWARSGRVCRFDELRYQKKKDVRRGTRAGPLPLLFETKPSGIGWTGRTLLVTGWVCIWGSRRRQRRDGKRDLRDSKFGYDTKVWSHHHNPRTVANNSAGEVTLNMGITGPHLTITGGLCSGECRFIQAAQMLRLARWIWQLRVGCLRAFTRLGFCESRRTGALGDSSGSLQSLSTL